MLTGEKNRTFFFTFSEKSICDERECCQDYWIRCGLTTAQTRRIFKMILLSMAGSLISLKHKSAFARNKRFVSGKCLCLLYKLLRKLRNKTSDALASGLFWVRILHTISLLLCRFPHAPINCRFYSK